MTTNDAAPAPDADDLAARFPTLARIARSTGTVGYQQPDLNAELAPAYELLAAQAAQIANLTLRLEVEKRRHAHGMSKATEHDPPEVLATLGFWPECRCTECYAIEQLGMTLQRAERAERAEAECERLISERDGARDESAARQHEVNAYRAECERLRALLARYQWRAGVIGI